MNNLLQFVIRYSARIILFLLLEVIALTIGRQVQSKNQHGIFQHSSPVFSGKMYKFADNVYQYNHLQTLADSLSMKMLH
jgi:hypothetical protein